MTRISLLHEYASQSARARPDAPAITLGDTTLTYRQLDDASTRLARLLKEAGCQRGDRVCLFLPKSPPAIVAMLGVLKADCVYVPIDLSSPAARAARIVASCEPRLILADRSAVELLHLIFMNPPTPEPVLFGSMDPEAFEHGPVCSRFAARDLERMDTGHLDYANTPDDPAHILFTSGSTGTPKGVVITHSNVSHFVEWARGYFGIAPGDRVSGHPPLHFDLSTFDIYGTLSAGAHLHLVPPSLNLLPNGLVQLIRNAELTQWFSVPSVLTLIAKFDLVRHGDFPRLRRVLWCGEVMPTPTLMYLMERLPHVVFTNLYGPTEATIASSYYTVPQRPRDPCDQIPIGTACQGEALYVLDEALDAVAPGDVGDLYIAGAGLSPGYWHDAEKTDAVFRRRRRPEGTVERIYQTGDLARVGGDGWVYFLGRADTQIKSRGHRIELGEIETAFNALGMFQDCAVVGVPDALEGTAICCAYVAQNGADVSPIMLRQRVAELLPGYMLPRRWKTLSELPKNANGKTDRRVLKEWFTRDATA